MTRGHEVPGGGSGGGAGADDDGNALQSVKSTYQIAGNQVVLLSRKPLPPNKSAASVITILAAGGLPTYADDGRVDIRGTKAVRITSGPPQYIAPLTTPPVSDESADGIEVIASDGQTITLKRGVFPGAINQSIVMTPDNITIDAGMGGSVTIKAGLNSITIDAKTGITISGLPFVKIN